MSNDRPLQRRPRSYTVRARFLSRAKAKTASYVYQMRAKILWLLLKCRWPIQPVLSLITFLSGSTVRLRAYQFAWLARTDTFRVAQLRDEMDCMSYGPTSSGETQRFVSTTIPKSYLHKFDDAIISPASSSVLVNGTIVVDGIDDHSGERLDYSQGHLRRHRGRQAIVRIRQHDDIPCGVFLAGNGSSNYYHWLIEILARTEFLDAIDPRYAAYPLLVSDSVLTTPTFSEMLEIFGRGREVVYLRSSRQYSVESLLYIDTPNQLPYNLNSREVLEICDTRIDPRSVNYLRSLALKHKSTRGTPNRVFLARSGSRRNYNQVEIENFLSGYDFAAVYMEETSFADQVAILNNADVVVGPTGAAWANLIFAKPGAKCICWMAKENGDFSAFSTMARVVGAELNYIRYSTSAKSTFELYSKPYHLDVNELRLSLDSMNIAPVVSNFTSDVSLSEAAYYE